LETPIATFISNLNTWGREKAPFAFLIDYAFRNPLAWRLEEIDPSAMLFDFGGVANTDSAKDTKELPAFFFQKNPVSFDLYEPKFNFVVDNLKAGNSFLVNLSLETPISTNLSLQQIFDHSEARFRLLFQDQFVCFSPELFVRIKNNRISSFPMKGTIDASIPGAAHLILTDQKETAEHATIVDLIRNDLSMVAEKVWVERYRYLEQITTLDKTLLQVSSEVAGLLPQDFNGAFGDLLSKMLPAGSICGAPKPRTLQIIQAAEQYDRGYYTGVMGYFDGENFESAVMIRFIERKNDGMVFKSGGGITARSNAESEYQEVIDKVYLPIRYAKQSVH
jgi:para-aminobenzoate synthetase component I